MNSYSHSPVRLASFAVKIAVLLATMVSIRAQAVTDFYNIIVSRAADPSIVLHTDGWYYRTNTSGNNVTIYRTRTLTGLGAPEKKVIWTPPSGTEYSKDIWAPEFFFYNNKWYVYFAAQGNGVTHRMFVLESSGADPFTSTWTFRGKMTDSTDRCAIDGTVFEVNGQLYTIWSGWPGAVNGVQNLYIAKMSNPYTISSSRVLISTPTYSWETNTSPKINEGPEVLIRNGKINLVYSASGSWADSYCLGLITASTSANLMSASSWTKKSTPVFSSGNGIYGPGHNTFTKSPDGTEDWIVYHCARWQGAGWSRQIRTQKFTWYADNTPNFGTPVSHDARIALPSGDGIRWRYEAESAALTGSPTVSSVSTASNGQYVTLDTTSKAVQFTVSASASSEYVLVARAATSTSDQSNASVNISVDGDTAFSIPVPHGGWANWTASATRLVLPAGSHTIRFTKDVGTVQLDGIDLSPTNRLPLFMLVNKNSSKSVDLIGGNTANGSAIGQWGGSANLDQYWTLMPTENGDHFRIISQTASLTTAKVLCVVANSTANGAQIHLWDYSGHAGQQWDLVHVSNGWFKIQNVNSGKVLEVANASTADGALLQQTTDTGSSAQLFRLQPMGDYLIQTFADKYLAVAGTTGANGAAVTQEARQGTDSFKWRFLDTTEGWGRVSSKVNLNRVMRISGSSTAPGADIVFWDFDAGFWSEQIRILPLTNGNYGSFKFYFRHSGMAWDIPGGSTASGIPLEQAPDNPALGRQQFDLERVY